MFYYLSFLRPPPLQVSPSRGNILITPQIANDLRTELFSDTHEIFYAWSSCRDRAEQKGLQTMSRPQKLTVWRENNAYKEIPVPFPNSVREGQTYRLHLTSGNQGFHSDPHIIHLGGDNIGERPFPVMSMPILFSSRPVKVSERDRSMSALKQEHVERIYRIPTGQDEQVFVNLVEQTSFDLDKVHLNSLCSH